MRLSKAEEYEFSLKGYIHLKNVIPKEILQKAHATADKLKLQKSDTLPKNSIPHIFSGKPFYHLHNMLECDDIFLEIMTNDEILSYVFSIVPQPCRLIESILLYRQKGLGNPVHRNSFSNLRTVDGKVQADYVGALVFLTDCGPDDGPTIVIEGSHHLKDKFPFHPVDPTWDLSQLSDDEKKFQKSTDGLIQIPFNQIPGYKEVHCIAGDVIFFSEDMIHGAKEVANQSSRLVLKYGFAPYYIGNLHGVEYSKELLDRCNELQKSLLGGPYYGYIFENSIVKEGTPVELFTKLKSKDVK